MEKLAKGRAKITEQGNTLQVVIPGKRTTLTIAMSIFYALFLVGFWPWGFYMVLQNFSVDDAPTLFFIVWLAGWTLGGLFTLYIIIWIWTRKEIISVSSGTLKIGRKVLGVGKSRIYDLYTVKDLRLYSNTETDTSSSGFNYWSWGFGFLGDGHGTLAFDYGLKTVDFARRIDKPEASFILDLFRNKGMNVSHPTNQ